MSHGDRVSALPDGFKVIATSGSRVSSYSGTRRTVIGAELLTPGSFHPSTASRPRRNAAISSASSSASAPPTWPSAVSSAMKVADAEPSGFEIR